MKHKHHIIPKHMGGSNDESNLIELTIEDHAKAHKDLWEKHGRWEDYYAWQGLSGIIPKKELIRAIQSTANKGKILTEGTKNKIRQSNIGKKQSELSKEKIGSKAKERWVNGIYDVEKLRLSRIGFKQPESQKKTVSEKLSKKWLIIDPKGQQYTIKNLRLFCRENQLDQGNLSRGSYKGWKAVKLET